MKNQVVLQGKDVYAKVILIDDQPIPDVNGIPYKRFAYDQLPFILREDQYKCWETNDMAELVLTQTEREVNGKNVESLTYGGHLTIEQDIALTAQEAKREAARVEAMKKFKPLDEQDHKAFAHVQGYELTRGQKKQTPYPPNPDREAPNQPVPGTERPLATSQERLQEAGNKQDTGGVNDRRGPSEHSQPEDQGGPGNHAAKPEDENVHARRHGKPGHGKK